MYYRGRKMARSRRGMRISENDGNARGRDSDKIPSVKGQQREVVIFVRVPKGHCRIDWVTAVRKLLKRADRTCPAQYLTSTKNNPCGGAVGPAFLRSRASINSLNDSAVRTPRPTSSRVPTILRTMWRRNAVASTV